MKTIFISTSMPGRARPNYFFALADSFVKDNYRVIMILDGKIKDFPKHDSILFFTWPSKRPTKVADFLFLKGLIKKYKPDTLISSFGSVNVMNLCGWIIGVKNRINYVLSVSDLFNRETSEMSFIKYSFLKYRKAFIYKLSTLLVANSNGVVQDLENYYGLKSIKTFVLPNLLEDSKLPYKNYQERNKQLLIVGNLIKLKGHSILLSQFKNALKTFSDLKLVIIGSGPEAERLKFQITSEEIGKHVKIIDSVDYSDIGSYFSNSLVHISASINEAFGFVNLEALREGTPIIVTRSAGGLELIKDNVNGLFFNLKDENSLADAVFKILNNWEDYSVGARNVFKENYEINSKINSHKRLLELKIN